MKCPKCGGTGEIEDDRLTGARMRIFRKSRSISLRDMAKAMGISAAYLSDLELGKRHWNQKQRLSFSNAL